MIIRRRWWWWWALAVPGACEEAVCTSLDGPRCPVINNKRQGVAPVEVSWREKLVQVVQRHLSESGKSRPILGGAFEIGGALPDADGNFFLKPGPWIRQPKGWITVGLKGQFEDNVTLSGFITDPASGDILEACSRFALQRRLPEDPQEELARFSLMGHWHGVYICAGTPTRLLLTLQHDHDTFAKEVSGVFEFAVMNDLNPHELKELTRLVSESLLELGLDDHDSPVQVFVIDDTTDEDDQPEGESAAADGAPARLAANRRPEDQDRLGATR